MSTMRLSGLISGMDTESIIQELVSAKQIKVDNTKKAQTKHEWKQEAWKSLNTKLKNLQSKYVANLRFSSSYMKKTTKVSNSSAVSVITGEDAVNGVQELSVKQLAKTAYLTGGKVQAGEEGKKWDALSKISDVMGADFKAGDITFTTGGKTVDIEVTEDTTISDFLSKIKASGLNANFDAGQQRFFISAKQSGADSNFSMAMHSLTHQDDKLTRAYIAKAYLTKVKGVDLKAANRMVSTEEGVEEALPASYRDHSDELLVMPIYELAERLYKIFSLERIVGEDAYVYAFFDCLTSFLTSNTATLDDFVEEWNENFASNTIQARSIDGIRLITIHKSKGLEFKHVIIPFCDWRMEKTNTIWCEPTEAPFNELPLVPVDFSAKQMMGTIYERDYIVEHLQNCVDNLNLLYVAFTRAERSLIVFARRGNTSLRSYVIEQAISEQLQVAVEDFVPRQT